MISKTLLPRLIAFFLAMALSLVCLADKVDVSDVEITEVYINSGGLMLMKIEGVTGWLEIGHVGNANAEAIYSTVLAAKMAKQNIWIRYWTQGDDYPTVGIISIK
ncbi:hypothetical protein QSV34_00030 [Porticoccus sp. W117]|uniref:hypothetical protein n=1 Tax=Porticoccus sp. W117 TaxID=3054777 RepID=UPI0025938661|nr:hypothetical protein [Porticoccus sp. W117]MDM3869728.1 hypothetical protein [Porticoccus sp. W117]